MEGRPLHEQELVRRAKQGDLDAFAVLVRAHQQAVHRLAYLITASNEDAEDAAQEAFMKAHAALDRFREGADFRPWLLRIAANSAKNKRRSVTRRRRRELTLAIDPGSGDAAPSPESAVVARRQQERLLRAIEGLPEKLRLAVVSRYLMEMPVAEAAMVLGVPEGTVKSRLARALDRLRSELDAMEPGDD